MYYFWLRLDDNKSAAGLFPCNHQVDIRMCSNRLLQLDDLKSAASNDTHYVGKAAKLVSAQHGMPLAMVLGIL